MKVLFDFDGLQYVAKRVLDTLQEEFFSKIMAKKSFLTCWVTADSVVRIQRWIEVRYSLEDASKFVRDLIVRCTVIPVRKASICSALKSRNGKFDPNINISIAELYHLDGIVTTHPEDYRYCNIPSIVPDDLPVHCAHFQKEEIKNVPFMNLKAPYDQIYPEIDERINRIITDNRFVLGPYVSEFEEKFAKLHETKYCVGVSSGTAALHLALMALGIGPGDFVLLPVNTFIATAEAVSIVGATPVFVDCDIYYNMDAAKVRKTIEAMVAKDMKSPKALIVVHLYGQSADMNQIMALAGEFNLMVIEDACQAHLARFNGKFVGQFAELSAFSFYPGKNLGSFGEAGALVTNDEALYLKAKMLRQHGEQKRYQHQIIGHNYRMSAIQGAVLGVKSKYLSEWTFKRQTIAHRYNELLADIEEIDLPQERAGTKCVYHLYVIQSDRRDELRRFLQENGIETGIHYRRTLHQQAAYSHLGYRSGDFPVAERVAQRILSLPMFPELSERQMKYVRDKIKTFHLKNWNI
jgi:dTDP-4-amino-4,6-dideoxygalactose transaminase